MSLLSYFRKRRNEMQETAAQLNMNFHIKDEYGLINMMKDFKLFKRGYGKKIRNILSNQRDVEQPDIRVFDYHYVVGGGNSTRRISQTVFYIHSKSLALPQFSIKPERFYHQVGEWMGMQDIDFEAFPDFSKQYVLQGPEEELIRKAMPEDFLQFFSVEKNWSVEGLNYLLIFYRSGERIHPKDIELFYSKGMQIFDMLKMKE